jgi:hypothetical protein
MDRPLGFLPFMDVLTGLMGIIILINIILSLSTAGDEGVKVRITPKEQDVVWSDKQIKPLFVVCTSDHILLHKTRIPITKIKMRTYLHDKIQASIAEQGADAYLLALIRPDGYRSFRYVRAAAEGLGLKLGYEPIDNNWELVY